MKGGDSPSAIFCEVVYFAFFPESQSVTFFVYHLNILMGKILPLFELTRLPGKSL